MAKNRKGTKNLAFPRIANYNCAAKYIMEQGLEQHCVLQPEMTRHTLELGTKYSPDSVCAPFKTSLGSMIEALDAGADTLIMTYGLCRLGYYGELQEQILRDLGYEFEMVNLSEFTTGKKKDYLKAVKKLNPNVNLVHFAAAGIEGLKMAEYVDEIEETYYKNCGFETEKGSCQKIFRKFLRDMEQVESRSEMDAGYKAAREALAGVELEKPEHPLRVGIVGEYFTVMDAFSNLNLEQKLADLGVEVHRWMNVSHRNIHYSGEKNLNVSIRDLCRFEMGPTSTANIWCARKYAEQGFDGIIHVKSAGCTPEIDVMPVLQNIGEEYKIPVLYLTYDSQTSDTGLMTRIEAFYDMIAMRKKVR